MSSDEEFFEFTRENPEALDGLIAELMRWTS